MNVDTGEFRALTAAAARAYDDGQDTFAYEVGTEIRSMTAGGSSDAQMLEVVQELIVARMEVGLPAAGWFAS